MLPRRLAHSRVRPAALPGRVPLKTAPLKAALLKAALLKTVLLTGALLAAGCSATTVTSVSDDLNAPGSVQSIETPDAASQPRGEGPEPTAPADDNADDGVDDDADADTGVVTTQSTALEPITVQTGAAQLADLDFEPYSGMTVGLVVNQTSVVDRSHLIDLVDQSTNVELGAIYAPEHGVRGTADAGELVNDDIDAATGVTIFSLYGSTRKPSLDMLAGIDVLFYDLQDVGTRHYTYISTMGLAMQTAAEADIPFVVLDRPNPLGGIRLFGPVLDRSLTSFIGQYPIPSGYGLTAGELAQAVKGERWLEGLDTLDLRIIQMQGWERSMLWPETGLDWVAPSPGLPTFDAALFYPGTVLIESTELSYGAGTPNPFSSVGATWLDAEALAAELNAAGLAGVTFEAVAFSPEKIVNIAPNPRLQGQQLQGIQLVSTDRTMLDPFLIGLELLSGIEQQGKALGRSSSIEHEQIFDLLTGSTQLRSDLLAGIAPQKIVDGLNSDLVAFDQLRQPYLLY